MQGDEAEDARELGAILARRGLTVADARECLGDDPLWPLVAGEMEAIAARRRRFRVLPGGTGPFRLPGWRPRLAVIAGDDASPSVL